jgi:hypothetical protein
MFASEPVAEGDSSRRGVEGTAGASPMLLAQQALHIQLKPWSPQNLQQYRET